MIAGVAGRHSLLRLAGQARRTSLRTPQHPSIAVILNLSEGSDLHPLGTNRATGEDRPDIGCPGVRRQHSRASSGRRTAAAVRRSFMEPAPSEAEGFRMTAFREP